MQAISGHPVSGHPLCSFIQIVKTMENIRVALDWTPNTIHSGLFMARDRGLYESAGLSVSFTSPAQDDYDVTPAKRVIMGLADVAIAPSESIVSYFVHPKYDNLVAIAAILQHDASAIVTLSNSGINRPAQLDGKIYASYQARYERLLLQEMIRHDGGKGDVEEIYPPKLGIWETLLKGKAHATWVFMPWEGLKAERAGIKLNAFKMDEYNVTYGYSPVLLTSSTSVQKSPETLRKFLSATSDGYKLAIKDSEKAASVLSKEVDEPESFLLESQKRLNDNFLNENGHFGIMKDAKWSQFIEFLYEKNMLEEDVYTSIKKDRLYTNMLLPEGS